MADFPFFKMAAVRHLGFLKVGKGPIQFGGTICVIVPNFAKIGRTVADIWPIFDFQDGFYNEEKLKFLFIVKAAVLKQQISKFYPQILSTDDSFHIYDRPLVGWLIGV